MPDSGIKKMEERAKAARSRWRVVAAVATALLVAKSLVGKAIELIWRKPNAGQAAGPPSLHINLKRAAAASAPIWDQRKFRIAASTYCLGSRDQSAQCSILLPGEWCA